MRAPVLLRAACRLAASGLVLLLGGCPPGGAGGGDAGVDGGAGGASALPVEVVRVDRGPLEERLEFAGKVEAARWVELPAEVAGVVVRILVQEGQTVERGEVLAELANPELAIAAQQARIARQRAELTLADLRAQEQAQQELLGQGFSTREAVDGLRRQRQGAELAVAETKAGESRIRLDLARLTLRSPFAGVVARRSLRTAGQRVAPGAPAFQIVQLDELLLRQRLPEGEVARLSAGLTARLVPMALPALVVPAQVARISPVVDATTGFQEVTLRLHPEQEQARQLKPGMFASASVLLASHPAALRVDRRALVRQGDRQRLFIVHDGAVEVRRPRLGLRDGPWVELLDGAAEGEQAVVLGHARLQDGARVRVVDPADDTPEASAAAAGRSGDAGAATDGARSKP